MNNTYYRFHSKLQSWKNKLLYAKCTDEAYISYIDQLLSVPAPIMMPENPLYFRINEDVPNPPDVYATGGPTTIYSERLTKLIIDTGISCEIIPVVMLGRTTNQSLPIKYNIVYLNEIHPAVNLEKTIKHDFIIEKLVLTENCKKQRHLFFRPEEIPYFILIHKDFKVILEEQKITGCEYLPLDSS